MTRKRWSGWKSGGGCAGAGRRLEDCTRDEAGRLPLTKRQRQIVDAISAHTAANGWPPTMRELCSLFGWSSPAAAWYHLRLIERKGWIERRPETCRGIRVVGA